MIVITGASGKTGSKVAEILLEKSVKVRVIGRYHDHLKSLGEKGAEVMTGDQADPEFLSRAFSGAKAAYLLVPSIHGQQDSKEYYGSMGEAAVSAIKKAKVKKVVFLSSLKLGTGTLTGSAEGLHIVERKLDALRKVDVVVLRAGLLFEHLLKYISLINDFKLNANETIASAPLQIITAREIGEKAASFLENPVFKGHSILNLSGQKWFFYPRLSPNIRRESTSRPNSLGLSKEPSLNLEPVGDTLPKSNQLVSRDPRISNSLAFIS